MDTLRDVDYLNNLCMKVMLNGRYGSCTMAMYFKNIYHGKRILITGNTGFKDHG